MDTSRAGMESDDNTGYEMPAGRNYRKGERDKTNNKSDIFVIDRRNIYLTNVLGNGNFGDVFKAHYNSPFRNITVAVKTCKLESDSPDMAAKFLEEAYRMQKLKHDHIINLIGVCPETPSWIIMELAEYGELTKYLRHNKSILPQRLLLSYAHQISTALSYLESKKFVHRDIAARNVLVCRPDRVKLGDFGLSRFVGEENIYLKSTVGKLPIKWMSPESINYRAFSSASDVWMFGVCMWEIMMLGEKPFADIKNDDVIDKVERGERLQCPHLCSQKLYSLMLRCWRYNPDERPRFKTIENELSGIHLEVGFKADETLMGNDRCLRHDFIDTINDLPPPKPPRYSKLGSDSYSSFNDYAYAADRISLYREHKPIYSSPCIPELPTVLEDIIEQQRKECEEDAEWLRQAESNFFS